MEVKFPDVVVPLSGIDSNAFAILGTVRRALKSAGVDHDAIAEFSDEATGGDYNHLLATVMRWVTVE